MFKIYDTSKSNTAKLSHVPSSFLRRVVYWLFSDNHAKMKHRKYKRSSIQPEKHAGNNQHLPGHKKYVHPIARFVVPHPFGSTDRHRLDIPRSRQSQLGCHRFEYIQCLITQGRIFPTAILNQIICIQQFTSTYTTVRMSIHERKHFSNSFRIDFGINIQQPNIFSTRSLHPNIPCFSNTQIFSLREIRHMILLRILF